MPLPETIRVKLSSEAAESIALTPVVVQQMAVRELLEHILAVTGKDEARVRDILLRGTVVSGASRFRWTGWQAEVEGLRTLLGTFPDPDPARAFAAGRCVHAVLRGGRGAIVIPKSAGERKGIFRRSNFWDALMEVASAGAAYSGYSYRDRADRFTRELSGDEIARLRQASPLLRYSTLRDQVQLGAFRSMEMLVER
jgi:hypothetical protein